MHYKMCYTVHEVKKMFEPDMKLAKQKVKIRYLKDEKRTVAEWGGFRVYTRAECLKCYNKNNDTKKRAIELRLSLRREWCQCCGELKHVVTSEYPIFYWKIFSLKSFLKQRFGRAQRKAPGE